MRPLSFLILVAGSTVALAESVIDYTKIPSCARQCTVLAQAEGGCVPPAASVTSQATYQSCFCLSGFLTTLHQSGDVCQSVCSADDATKISTYYNDLCNGPVVIPDTTTTTTSTATTTSTTATGSSTAGAVGKNKTVTTKKSTWWSTHWKWVLMVIIVTLAIIFFWVGGFLLKRRSDRKHDARRANMAAHDAPYTPGPPGARRSLPGILKGSSSQVNATPPMTAGSARPQSMTVSPNGMTMDGGVGGIAPPRGPRKLRSRSSTLQSLGLSNGSKANLPDPVAWGPHQFQTFYSVNHHGSPGNSVPPSPTSAFTPPHPVFRNREFVSSEPRFVQYRPAPTSISAESLSYSSTPGTSGRVNGTSMAGVSEIERPHTAGSAGQGPQPSDLTPIRESRAAKSSRLVSFAQSDPTLNESVFASPQSAEICHATPEKSHDPTSRVNPIF